MAEDLTSAEVLEALLEDRLSEVHTAMPGKIIAYNAAIQRADVEPQLRLGGEDLSVIPAVPVVWPLGYTDLSVGDTVLLVFCEADIGLWRQLGAPAEPQDIGRHGLHGAVAIAGLRPATTPLSHIPGSTVLPGSDVRIGDYNSVESVLRATTWAANMTAPSVGFLPALSAWVTAVSAAAGMAPGDPTIVALQAAIATYVAGISIGAPWLSLRVRVP